MKTILVLLLALLTVPSLLHTQPGIFIVPIEGQPGKDYFIVNYLDHDTATGKLLDYHCGVQTYDGHMGTDIVLRNFRQMDSGVPVIAPASGRVMEVIDTAFDRNKRWNPSLGFANYILIRHADSMYSYCAHIRKGSALVKVGDSVIQGQRIAQVACAGNCISPHVHFEVYRNFTLMDPFQGSCNSGKTYWKSQPQYDTTFGVIDYGMVGWVSTDAQFMYDTLGERPTTQISFSPGKDSVITFWIQEYGIKAGDTSRVEWYNSSSSQSWFIFEFIHSDPSRYYYWWTYINTPVTSGELWQAKYSINSKLILAQPFMISQTGAVSSPATHKGYKVVLRDGMLSLSVPENAVSTHLTVELYNPLGARLATLYDAPPRTTSLNISIPKQPGITFAYIKQGTFTASIPITTQQ